MKIFYGILILFSNKSKKLLLINPKKYIQRTSKIKKKPSCLYGNNTLQHELKFNTRSYEYC